MEKIEELKKKIQCQKCHKTYNENDTAWIHVECQHYACDDCCEGFDSTCPICNCSTGYTQYSLTKDMLTTLNDYESLILQYDKAEIELRDENSTLKEKLFLLEAPKEDHHKCAGCEKSDSEQDMQLCETCHGLKFENLEDVQKHALCSTCAIKKHMRKGHHTVDFYPYLSAYNFSSHSLNIESKSEEYKSAQELLNNTFSHFNDLSINVSENYNVLTDMARRSKNTKKQLEFFEKMEKFIDKSKSIHNEADCDMKNHTTKLEETLTEIKKWYDSRMGNCVDESEIVKLPNSEDSDKNDTEVDA